MVRPARAMIRCAFELTAAALAPEIEVIAPWRDERFRTQFPGRAEMIAYCEEKSIPVQASAKKPFSMDRNLLHISYEAGILEDPWFDAGDLKYKGYFNTLSVFPEDAPDKAETVILDFENGNCIAVNGKAADSARVMRCSTSSAASTASVVWTWWKTASSA
jgi:argininosuccinate synthase